MTIILQSLNVYYFVNYSELCKMIMWQSRCALQIQRNCWLCTLFVTLHNHKLDHLHHTLAITDDGAEVTYDQAFFFSANFVEEKGKPDHSLVSPEGVRYNELTVVRTLLI